MSTEDVVVVSNNKEIGKQGKGSNAECTEAKTKNGKSKTRERNGDIKAIRGKWDDMRE